MEQTYGFKFEVLGAVEAALCRGIAAHNINKENVFEWAYIANQLRITASNIEVLIKRILDERSSSGKKEKEV